MNSFQSHMNYLVSQLMDVVTLPAGMNNEMMLHSTFWSVFLYIFNFCCSDATTMGLIKVRGTYPFGVDPKWHGTRSELPFLNSLKMKMSILLGVAQMNLGIILSYFNAKFFNDNLNIW